jgi:hypothetical protein
MKKNINYKEDFFIKDDVDVFLYKFIMLFLLTLQIIIEIFNVEDYNYFMKPFIIVMVCFFYLFKTNKITTKKERFILYSLICSIFQTLVTFFEQHFNFVLMRYVLSVFYLILNIISLKIETKTINIPVSQSITINLPFVICFMFCLSFLKIDLKWIFHILVYSSLLFIYVSFSNLKKFKSDDQSYKLLLTSSLLYCFSELLTGFKLLNNSSLPLIHVFITISYQISQILKVLNTFHSKTANSTKFHNIPNHSD